MRLIKMHSNYFGGGSAGMKEYVAEIVMTQCTSTAVRCEVRLLWLAAEDRRVVLI